MNDFNIVSREPGPIQSCALMYICSGSDAREDIPRARPRETEVHHKRSKGILHEGGKAGSRPGWPHRRGQVTE